MEKTLDKTTQDRKTLGKLNFKEIEERWQNHWANSTVYHWDESAPRSENFVIDTPPPTVSGVLHIGHVYSYTHTDFIARYRRMKGMNVYYPMGFDDNGLPTERLVEKRRKVRASDMSREAFVALCHEVVEDAENDFRSLFRRVGLSVDWRQEYQTVSSSSWKVSQMSLLDLYQKGHLYRAPQPSLWDPADRTAIAQAEVVDKEQTGTMYAIPFTTAEGQTLEVATTRPELLPACVALMVHPEDPQNAQFVGTTVQSPLFRVAVPVIADERVDPDKGTGRVMCCTFGDQTDVEWWRDHALPLRPIIGRDGRLGNMGGMGGEDWPSADIAAARDICAQLHGLKVREARSKVVELLASQSLLLGETTVTHAVPCAERSGAPLEILVTEQWLVRLLDKKDALLEAGRAMRWHPQFMQQRYEEWVSNLKWDWCISRQRFFGVPLPFWYSRRPGEEGKVILPTVDELPVNPLVTPPQGYRMDEVEPETDVMDTWATSSVSPQINSHAVSPDMGLDFDRHSKLFPATLRPQAHEIIRTWTFYTVAKAVLHQGCAPFEDLAISGWCLASDQTKMSKSKGNVVTPDDVMGRYGVDVVRYWAAQGRLGRDTAYSEDVLKVGKRLTTKLWNASKLVQSHLDAGIEWGETAAQAVASGIISNGLDRWCLDQLGQTIADASAHFEAYAYSDALAVAERFFWKTYCDNYLELAKGRLYGDLGRNAEQVSAKATLYHVHRAVLALFAPFMPYVTEELFDQLYQGAASTAMASVHSRSSWPDRSHFPDDAQARRVGDLAVEILSAIRKMKSVNQASIRAPLGVVSVAPCLHDGTPAEGKATAEIPSMVELAEVLRDVAHAGNCQDFAHCADPTDGPDWHAGERDIMRIRAQFLTETA